MSIIGETKARAFPTKEFFVRMITRDIGLDDCILDLVDNSIDSAWNQRGGRPTGLAEHVDLSAYRIDIEVLPHRFAITDNCGGMTLDDAVNHAFSFGRPPETEHEAFSIGVYGIGMKRAVFKIGRDIKVRSTFADGNDRTAFVVPIEVDKWLRDRRPEWDFDIEVDQPLPADGVQITVGDLTKGTEDAFQNPLFLQDLRRTLARDYSLHLARGLTITVNEIPIQEVHFELRQSEEFVPLRHEYQDEVDGERVIVEIFAGMAAPPPETNEPADEGQGDARYGWYVICNGRVVLAADKTDVSGWGTENWPQWHRQYSGFIGIILFSAENATALPLTTTKRSVEVSSEIWRRARPRMREATKAWISYTNQRKQGLEDAKARESQAVSVSLERIRPMTTVRLPQIVAAPSVPSANVNYIVPRDRLRSLAKEFGDIRMTYREVGIRSFEYAYDDLVSKD
ncbi:MAG: ATP-binding protein [Nisaea sp.]|uniref:ATP-binding protein n=1 Tax=Nisaea sp. TaxID=2024842 RepID=UPI003266714D